VSDRTQTATVEPPVPQAGTAAARVIVGRTLGRYEIVAPLGAGGMADVWLGRSKAEHGFVRLCAVKTARADVLHDARLRAMFLREARLAASIRHANVVDVLDVGEVDDILFLAMELIDGDSLAGLLAAAEDTLPAPVALSIVVDALRGLHAAHELTDDMGAPRHLVHRDVSPQNILVGLDGVARVSDFGIAAVVAEDGDDTTGALRGKYAYFAPEQARREALDRRSDVFAMGVVLWEALTGKRLFKGRDALDTIERVKSAAITDPREHVRDLPDAIAAVVVKALQRAPGERYASAEEMADALVDAAATSSMRLERRAVAAIVERLAGAKVRDLVRRARTTGLAADSALPRITATPTTLPVDVRAVAPAPTTPAAERSPRTPRRIAMTVALVAVAGATGVVAARMSTSNESSASTSNAPPATGSTAVIASVAPPLPASPATAAPSASASTAPSASASSKPVTTRWRPRPSAAPSAAPPPAAAPAPAETARRPPFEENPFDRAAKR